MDLFFSILIEVIAPVFILIGMGIFLHRMFHFDLKTLSKITTYYLLPVVAFVNLYESNLDKTIFFEILKFQLIFSIILMVYGAIMSKILKLDRGMTANFKNSVVLMNSGNFGLPVSQLVFASNPVGVTIQIVVMTIQTFITHTYGLLNTVSAKYDKSKIAREILKNPILYALLLGFLFNTYHIPIPTFIWIPLEGVNASFLPIALLALGAQVAFMSLKMMNWTLSLSCISRLLIAPALALALIYILGLDGVTAQGLLIASSFPASRNSAQMALEYDVYPEFAGQTVLITTVFSVVTVTGVIYLSQLLFG